MVWTVPNNNAIYVQHEFNHHKFIHCIQPVYKFRFSFQSCFFLTSQQCASHHPNQWINESIYQASFWITLHVVLVEHVDMIHIIPRFDDDFVHWIDHYQRWSNGGIVSCEKSCNRASAFFLPTGSRPKGTIEPISAGMSLKQKWERKGNETFLPIGPRTSTFQRNFVFITGIRHPTRNHVRSPTWSAQYSTWTILGIWITSFLLAPKKLSSTDKNQQWALVENGRHKTTAG